jgi:hypothetical protein
MRTLIGATKQTNVRERIVDDVFDIMENDERVMRNYEISFLTNIARKVGSGKFDKTKLPKLMEYLYTNNRDHLINKYQRFYDDSLKLNPAERKKLADMWSDKAIDDLGEYDELYNGRTGKYEPIKKFTKGKKIAGIFLK